MSFVSEVALFAPPVRGRFDFSDSVRAARRLLVKRVWPNLRDASDLVYRKTAATGIWLASPLLWLEEMTTFNEADYPVPVRSTKMRRPRTGYEYAGMSATASAAFLVALLAPSDFAPTKTGSLRPEPIAFSQSEAAEHEAVVDYPRMYSPEWYAGRERLLANYVARRAAQYVAPVSDTPVSAVQEVGPAQVTSFFESEEYSGF
jgi:hypothetical protein